jgi:hypothetical protein
LTKKKPFNPIVARPLTLLTLPTGIYSDFARLISNLKQLRNIRTRITSNKVDLG